MTEQTKIRAVNPIPADDNEARRSPPEDYRTQDQWIDLCNLKRKAMISAPDYYRTPDVELQGLIKDLNKGKLVTSTSIVYNSNDLGARVVHNFGSIIVKPTEQSIVIPVYNGEPIEEVVRGEDLYHKMLYDTLEASDYIARIRNENIEVAEQAEQFVKGYGLKFLQALFDTEDDASKLIERLEKISNKEAKDIRIRTPSFIGRGTISVPKRAVTLSLHHTEGFVLDGRSFWFEDYPEN
ncbi:MAG: hypothetical protein Q8R00_00765 [Candidatus Nanoarchaeia archaeon]|nr:hypothetical protein [Candidatus Nanoarchaeia archaeon]